VQPPLLSHRRDGVDPPLAYSLQLVFAAVVGADHEPAYPEGDLRVAVIRDPTGNLVGVWQQGPREVG
jgi:hypothetical protein